MSEIEHIEATLETPSTEADAPHSPAPEDGALELPDPEIPQIPKRNWQGVLLDLQGTGRTPEQLLEALLFSTHKPLTKDEIGDALRMESDAVEHSLNRLEQSLAQRETPLGLFSRAKGAAKKDLGRLGYILDVRSTYRRSIPNSRPTLGQSATETLALIALNQPISQSRLVRERGSSVYEHVKEFLQKGWVHRVKRGRSYELRTTDSFAAEFGLANDPDLIKRALAKAAGAEGHPEIVGSHRVHIDADAEGIAALVDEATKAFVPPIELPPMPAPMPAEDCLVSTEPGVLAAAVADGAPAECLVDVAQTPAAEAECLVDVGTEIQEEREAPAPTSPAPTTPTTPVPEADCLVAVDAIMTPKEAPMSETTPPEQEPKAEDVPMDSGAHRRVTKLFSMFEDESTDDDW